MSTRTLYRKLVDPHRIDHRRAERVARRRSARDERIHQSPGVRRTRSERARGAATPPAARGGQPHHPDPRGIPARDPRPLVAPAGGNARTQLCEGGHPAIWDQRSPAGDRAHRDAGTRVGAPRHGGPVRGQSLNHRRCAARSGSASARRKSSTCWRRWQGGPVVQGGAL
jgi:hypothetical protein